MIDAIPGPDPITNAQSVFLQYGAIGAILLVLLWFAYGAIKREREATDRERTRAEKAEAEKDELNRVVRAEVIPVLTRAADATVKVTELMADVAAALRDARR
jgi:hypothetical protein